MTIESLRPRFVASALCVIACCLLSACIFSSREVADGPDSDTVDTASDTATSDADDAVDPDADDTTDGTSDVSDTSETGDTDDATASDVDADTDLECSDPLKICEGECVDFGTNPQHCGGCGQPCRVMENAVATCDASECVYTCEEGFSDLNGDLGEEGSNGCEGEVNCSEEELRTYYFDGDGDGFGTPNTKLETCPSEKPDDYVANFGDCDDQDDRVNEEYDGGFRTEPSSGGTFDYNCDDDREKEDTTVGECAALQLCKVTEGWEGSVPDCGVEAPYINDCGGIGCEADTSDRKQGCK